MTKSLDENGDGNVSEEEYFKLFDAHLEAIDEEGKASAGAHVRRPSLTPSLTRSATKPWS